RVARFPALAVSVARARAAIAPRMIVFVRTIRPPCGVVAFYNGGGPARLRPGAIVERVFGSLGSLAEFVGPQDRHEPAILLDVAMGHEALEGTVHVFPTGRDHRGQGALREPQIDADTVRRLASMLLTQVEELSGDSS